MTIDNEKLICDVLFHRFGTVPSELLANRGEPENQGNVWIGDDTLGTRFAVSSVDLVSKF